MAIAPTVGELVPGWVYEDKFPEGDEAKLAQLAQAWTNQAESNTSRAEELGRAMDALSETYSGRAARAAKASATKTQQWLESGAEGCTSLAEACTAASVLITTTKVAMNVVLLSLQVTTQKILKSEGGNLLDTAKKLIKIRQVQIAAQAHIDALSKALVTKLGELGPEVEIKPELPKPKSLQLPGLDNAVNPIGSVDGPNGSPVGGVPMEDGFPDVSDIVGSDEANAAMEDNGTAPGMSPGGSDPTDPSDLRNASDAALTEDERDELYDDAIDTLENGDTDGYTDSDLYEDAEQVDEDAIPETAYDAPASGTGADTDDMTTEQILGEDPAQRTDPIIPNEDFEDGSVPAPNVEDGPPPHGPPPGDGSETPPDDSRPAPQPDETPPGDEPGSGAPEAGGNSGSGGSSGTGNDSGTDSGPADPTPRHPVTPAPGPSDRTPWHPPAPPGEQPSYSPPVDPGPGPDSGGGHQPSPAPSDNPPPVESVPDAPKEPGTSGAGVAPPPVGTPPAPGTAPPPPSTGFNPGPGTGNHLGGGSGVGGGSGLGGTGLGGGSGVGGGPGVGGSAGLGGGIGGSAPAPSAPAVGGSPPTSAPPPTTSVPQQAAGQPGGAVPPSTPPPSTPPANTPPSSTPPSSTPPSSQPPGPTKDVRVPDPRPPFGPQEPNPTSVPGRNEALGALVGAGLMASGLGLAALWADLGKPTPGTGPRPSGDRYLPTQFGREDVLLAALPAGMAEIYQRTLVPGEADAFLTGVVTTLRGLVHPYDQVCDLQTPAALHDALGLGFGVLTGTGGTELAFDRNDSHVDVLRFNGVRPEDLVVPVAADVVPPANSSIPYVVRQHAAPWTGSGEAPGSTLDHPIDEFEILGTSSVAIPHLAEIWRIDSDGGENHVATFNARSGVWVGAPTPEPLPGRVVDNGLFAQTPDGMTYQVVTLTDREHILIARGLTAPEYFLPAEDGTSRWIAGTDELLALIGVTNLATWQGATVQVLRREGGHCLVDYAGSAPDHAAALGFRQLNQGQWAPQWVAYAELTDQREVERTYPLPEPAEQVEDILSGRPVAPPPAPRPV